MTWQIGDHCFIMTLSALVPELIESHLPSFLAPWLGDRGLRIEDIANWIVHPGGPRILDAVGASLNLPASALSDSRAVLAEYGNMSSPTVLFILERMLSRQASGPCLMLAFGPGLTIEAALLK
jgi:predicted naringenin-chalcone synthase